MKIQFLILLFCASFISNAAVITNSISPTAHPLNYVIRFSADASTILSSATELNKITCSLTSSGSTTNPTCVKSWICSDNTCLLISLSVTTIPLQSVVTFDFSAVTATTDTFASDSLSVNSIAYDTPDSLMDILKDMEFYMAIIWGGLALINMFPNPYSLVYLYGKLYMETLDTFKMANIQYSSWVNTYYFYNNNKVSGLRVPNLFSILLFGDEWNSGYDLANYEYVSIVGRGSDNKIYAYDKFHQYTPYALFLDNYGIQIESFVIILFFVGFVELIRWLVLRNNTRKEGSFTKKVRYLLRWNLFYAIFFGSYLTALFYGVAQIFAYVNSDDILHNTISFGIGVGVLGIYLILTIITFIRIKRLIRDRVYSSSSFHAILIRGYKPEKFKYPMNLILLVVKIIGFVTVLVIPNIDPLVQVSILLGLELAYFLYIVIVRPFAHKYWLVFQIIYELILMLVLSCMMVIAVADYNNDLTSSLREIPVYIIGYCSIALPYLNSLFAIYEIIQAILNRHKRDQVSPLREGQNTEVPASYIDPTTVQAFKADPFISIDKTDYPRNTVFAEVSIDHAERLPANGIVVPQTNRLNQYGNETSNNHSRNESAMIPENLKDRDSEIKTEPTEKTTKITKFTVNDLDKGNIARKFNVNGNKEGPIIVDHRIENDFLKTNDNYQPGTFNVSQQNVPHTQLDSEYRIGTKSYNDKSNHNVHGRETLTNFNYLTGDKSNFQSPVHNYYPSNKLETKLNFDAVKLDNLPPIRNKNTVPSRNVDNKVHVFNDNPVNSSGRPYINSGRIQLELNDKSKSYIDEDGFRNYTNKFSLGM